jgi:hypothetical protein
MAEFIFLYIKDYIVNVTQMECFSTSILRIHRCATRDICLRFCCPTHYVMSTRISGKYICSIFNTNVLRKNGFRRFLSDQDKNIS